LKSSVRNSLAFFVVYLTVMSASGYSSGVNNLSVAGSHNIYLNAISLVSSNTLLRVPLTLSLLFSFADDFNNLLAQADSLAGDFGLPRPGYGKLGAGTPEEKNRKQYTSDSVYVEISPDSTGKKFLIEEKFDKYDISHPFEIDLDKYLELRKTKLRSDIWDSILTHYDLKQALSGGDIARMLSQATGFAIPVPPNPIINLFGKPEININVSGEVNLRLGWRWDSQNLGTVSAFGQTQSTPIFSQDIRVRVDAKIGDKLKLGTDWNTRRQFEHENKFKIGYEGEDDDIVKLIEVGNVSLPLQGLIGGGQALFGVRADFQFGPLFLKTIASQRRGERKTVKVQGGVSTQIFSIRAYDYSRNHFFLDNAYKSIYVKYFKSSTPVIPNDDQSREIEVKQQVEVWESTNNVTDISRDAKAFATLPGIRRLQGTIYDDTIKKANLALGEVIAAKFMKLDTNRFKLSTSLGTISIFNLRPDRYYAIAYRIQSKSSGDDDDIFYGDFQDMAGQKDTLILKLLYVPNMQPSFDTLWSRQMKNIYSINATGVNVRDTKIGVWYLNQSNDSTDLLPNVPEKLVTILRVDQVNNSTGAPTPDGLFDLQPPFFDPNRGEITFPELEPFASGLRTYFKEKMQNENLADQFVYRDVYDTTVEAAKRNSNKDRFIISGEVSGRATNRISLGAINLAEKSVKVTLDGVPLKEYDDYVVDYYAGIITLRNQRATLPNANLNIEYESNDVFNITTRTLLGLRADYELYRSRNLQAGIGFTGMFYDQSVIQDRVRLGDEPVSNMMIGFDGNLRWDVPWMTELLSKLPFYDTKVKSSFALRGEWAMMLPEPNKRLSEVTEDMNEPVVYIDDFEGAQKYISLGLTPTQWSYSSPPADSSIGNSDFSRTLLKGQAFWYQYFIPRVEIQEVYPKRQTVQGRQRLSPLYLNFDPKKRGIYNTNPEYLDKENSSYDSLQMEQFFAAKKDSIWGGMMRLLSSFNTNFDNENIEYIEIMMRVNAWEPFKTKMYIDLGNISEDVIANGALDTEDGSTPQNPLPNNIIDANEDKGIDRLTSEEEKALLAQNPQTAVLANEKDPAKDDYYFDFSKDDENRTETDFVSYNNFENNSKYAELGQFPDTEILNKNNGQTISLTNSYFSYEVDLLPIPEQNPQIVGGGSNGWYLYRIPIRKPSKSVGNPQFSNIQYARIWFKGGLANVAIADWRLAGSHWQRLSNMQSNVPENDSVLQVAYVNVEENYEAPDYYRMPPGVKAPRQLNSPDPTRDIRLNEQSASISVKNLRYGEERMAVRFFRQMDLFYYKKLRFFVHGDGSMPDNIVPGATPKAYAFIRFGIDSSNYYELRKPLLRGWQSVNINLEDLTAIKQLRDITKIYERQLFPVPGDELASFAIKGNPILTRVQYFGFGIANPSERYPDELTTTMWVDELRLLSPEKSNDWAAVVSSELKMADIATLNASFRHSNPNFHRLEERFGNRITATDWNFTGQANLEKFAPKSFKQAKVPLTYSHTEGMQDPQFVANNDINLDAAANAAVERARKAAEVQGRTLTNSEIDFINDTTRKPSQTLKVQDSWALTGVKLGIPVDSWWIRETLNQLTVNYSYSQEFERNPLLEQRFNWIWKLGLNYSVNIPPVLTVSPFEWAKNIPLISSYEKTKINFLPTNLSANFDMSRRRSTEKSRFLDYPSPVIRDFSNIRSIQFTWRIAENGFINPSIDYSFNTLSTLVPFELDETGKQRTGSQLADIVFFNNGKLLFLGKDNIHGQNFTLNIKPRLPIGAYEKYIDMTGAFTTQYSWMDPLQQDPSIRDVVKQVSYNNTIRFNMPIKLKALADDLFGTPKPLNLPNRPPTLDSSKYGGRSGFGSVMSDIGTTLKFIFLDYEKIDIIFNQSNSAVNPGALGGNGLTNMWSLRASDEIYGPSAAYQLGLVPYPHGGFRLVGSNSFPFFGFETFPGKRPPNAILQDNFTQRTKLDIKTSRPLWTGATLELNWGTELGWTERHNSETDAFGNQTFTNSIALQSYNRTFLTFPSIFGVNVFNNTIEHVLELYGARRTNIIATETDDVKRNQKLLLALSESFYNGMEAFSLSGGDAGKFLPAVNWQIKWEGIEKWGIWNGTVQKITIDHRYASTYLERVEITSLGKAIQAQSVQYGFQPLIGVNAAFNEDKLDGILTANLRYSTTSNYSLNSSNKATITKTASDEFQLQASYAKKKFEIQFIGLNLENEIEFSFLASVKSNKTATFDVTFDDNNQTANNGKDGRTLNGTTQITVEPRIRYTMSKRVVASLFYRYEGTFNEGAAQPGFYVQQVGFDIKINIAGGR
jgi:hypothetical protein